MTVTAGGGAPGTHWAGAEGEPYEKEPSGPHGGGVAAGTCPGVSFQSPLCSSWLGRSA